MNHHDHERAIDLIIRRGAEQIAAPDSAWLESHLGLCTECSAFATDFDDTGAMLRAVAVTASPSLVMTTQARLRTRALQMQEQQSRRVLIAISFCIGALSSAGSAWLWWRVGGWVAERLALSQAIVQPGIFLSLLLPAVVIAGLMLAFPTPVLEGKFMAALARERDGGDQ